MSEAAPDWAPLTPEIAPARFRARVELEDFVVSELPLSEPGEVGDHVVFTLEKRGIDTLEALRRLARALGRAPDEFGFAGRKDARARTRQRVTLEHLDPTRLAALDLPGLRLEPLGRQARKLRLGELAGNRFELRLREVADEDAARIVAVLERLEARGMANFVGAQRFGRHGDNASLGRELVAGSPAAYLAALARDVPGQAADAFRRALAGGRAERRGLARVAPALGPDLSAAARQLARRPDDLVRAAAAVPHATRRFHVSAAQSAAFNAVLAERVRRGWLGTLFAGDLVLVPEDPRPQRVPAEESARRALQERAERLEISASGPLPGPRAPRAEGLPGELEDGVLAGVAAGFEEAPGASAAPPFPGARRPLRVALVGLEVARRGGSLELAFALPPGAYATSLLDELRKGPEPRVS